MDLRLSLGEMQNGRPAKLNVRPMQSIGPGVFELKDADEKNWYRMIYLKRVGDRIHVLDCFEKDTAKTERKDLHRAKARLSALRHRLLQERKERSQL